MFRKIWNYLKTPRTSIFRYVDRPHVCCHTEKRGNEVWLITKIRCDWCKKGCDECTFDYEDRKWMCAICEQRLHEK